MSKASTVPEDTRIPDIERRLRALETAPRLGYSALEADGSAVAVVDPLVVAAGVRAYRSTAQSVSSATWTAVSFDAESYDTDGYHDPATNPTRLTVPAGRAGTYAVAASVLFAASAAGTKAGIRLVLNGVTVLSTQEEPKPAVAATQAVAVADLLSLAVGDWVEVEAYQDTGAALDTSAGTAQTFVAVMRVGNVGALPDHAHTATTDDGGVLTADEHASYSEYAEVAAPTTPAASKIRLYAKADGHLYQKDAAGTETDLAAGRAIEQVLIEASVAGTVVNPTPSVPTNVPDLAAISVTITATRTLRYRYQADLVKGDDAHKVRFDVTRDGTLLGSEKYSQSVGEDARQEILAEWVEKAVAAGTYTIRVTMDAAIGTSSTTFTTHHLSVEVIA